MSAQEAAAAARTYLATANESGVRARQVSLLAKPDVLMALCGILHDEVEANAGGVFAEASSLYGVINRPDVNLGSFDEKDYFLGETALLSATASRLLGRRDEAELWLDRAEAGFRLTANPAPLLANATYQRLALRYEARRFGEVAELASMLSATFGRLAMGREHAKCLFLEASALKENGDHETALAKFAQLRACPQADPGLVGSALVTMADIHVAAGDDDKAAAAYVEALPLLDRRKRPAAVAHLKSVFGETLRRQGRLTEAIAAYRDSIQAYADIGMTTFVAYIRILLAQTLLEAGRGREAEWEVLAALPTIDEQKMVPEGFAAVSLLRESVRQRKTDPRALLELREYLQTKA